MVTELNKRPISARRSQGPFAAVMVPKTTAKKKKKKERKKER